MLYFSGTESMCDVWTNVETPTLHITSVSDWWIHSCLGSRVDTR